MIKCYKIPMKVLLFTLFIFWFSDVYSQFSAFSDDSTCLKYRKQAIQKYEHNPFVFDLVDANITSRDLYIDSVAKARYNLIIERHETLPYEICGTAQLEMECYFSARDSIYREMIGTNYLDRLIENSGFDYDILNGKNIDSVHHVYPDSSITFDYSLIYKTRAVLSKLVNNITIIDLQIKSNTSLEIEAFTYDIKLNHIPKQNLEEVEAVLNNFKSNFNVKESAVHNGKKVNSIYTTTLFIMPEK